MTKATLVSIWHRGKTTAFMVMAEIGPDGKARISHQQIEKMTDEAGVPKGSAFALM